MTSIQPMSSRSIEIIKAISGAVSRLEKPPPHLFNQLYWEEKMRIEKMRSQILRRRSSIREKGYAAAVRVLLNDEAAKLNCKTRHGTYLERMKTGEY